MSEDSNDALLRSGNAAARSMAAKIMGSSTSEAKAKAARENGKRGGRPKGTPVSDETRNKISAAKRKKSINSTNSESPAI